MKNSIIVNNITAVDTDTYKIRITRDNKFLFPAEQPGKRVIYPVICRINRENYNAKYVIGSKDGKERSGILNLGSDVYQTVLRIKEGTQLKIGRSNDGVYLINKT
ncbi:MAG: hypothetical protein WD509_02700 [Candidatus Paceibacterota bacterium]